MRRLIYRCWKITGTAAITGVQAPKGGSLSAAEIQAIDDWIAAGGQND